MHERPGDHHPLPLPAGEEVRLVPSSVEEAELLEQLVGPRFALECRHAVVGGVEDQVVPDGDRPVEVAPLRHDRELLPGTHGIPDDVDPTDSRRSTRRPNASRRHPDRRRLAGSVGAEQSEHLPGRGGKGDAVHRIHRCLRIPLDEIDYLDGEVCGVLGEHLEIVGAGRRLRPQSGVLSGSLDQGLGPREDCSAEISPR